MTEPSMIASEICACAELVETVTRRLDALAGKMPADDLHRFERAVPGQDWLNNDTADRMRQFAETLT